MTQPIVRKFSQLAQVMIQKYERYLPTAFDENLTLLEKVNKIIEYLNQIGKISNDVVEQWNIVVEWVLNDGLIESTNEIVDKMYQDGRLAQLINVQMIGSLQNLDTEFTEHLVGAINEVYQILSDTNINVDSLSSEIDDTKDEINDVNNSLSYEINDVNKSLNNTIANQINNVTLGIEDTIDDKINDVNVDGKIANLNNRIDNIITTPTEGISEQEIIDARQGETSLMENINKISQASLQRKTTTGPYSHMDEINDLGMYRSTSTNMPEGFPSLPGLPSTTGGLIIVFKQVADDFSSQTGTVQLVITAEGYVFIRYKTSQGWQTFRHLTQFTHFNFDEYIKLFKTREKMFKEWETKYNFPYYASKERLFYPAGEKISGLPYSSVFHLGNDILYNKNLSSFYSAVENPASVLYTEVAEKLGGNRHTIWGQVCSTVTGWLCGEDIYRITVELKDYLEFYEYSDIIDVKVGDIMLTDGHAKMISDIIYHEDGRVHRVGVLEGTMPTLVSIYYTIKGFEGQLEINGGTYRMGRYPNFKGIRSLPKIEYATDCIPDMGDKSVYKDGQQIWLYINNDSTNLRYRKKGTSTWSSILLSTLNNKTVNNVKVYNITNLCDSVGIWEITTNTSNPIFCNILIANTGDVNVNNAEVVAENYSDEITPLWYQILRIYEEGEIEPPDNYKQYPSPTGYYTIEWHRHKYYYTSPTFPEPDDCDGYYVRLHYKTPYGQIFKDSDFVYY